jgi:DNA primase
MYRHDWCGVPVGYTWFNSPELSSHSLSAPKYKYDKNIIGGMVTPYDVAVTCNSFIITEGEKDMLTLQSFGVPNAVAKIGGAKTKIVGGLNMMNKKIVIIYDCDNAGREGAIADADYLTDTFAAKVKVVDLGLQNGEDVNDYFMKYGKSLKDLQDLIRNTPVHIVQPKTKRTHVQALLDSLSPEEVKELKELLKENA